MVVNNSNFGIKCAQGKKLDGLFSFGGKIIANFIFLTTFNPLSLLMYLFKKLKKNYLRILFISLFTVGLLASCHQKTGSDTDTTSNDPKQLALQYLSQNKLDEAEKPFRAAVDEPLPFTATLAWGNIGLGEISMKRNQPAEAAKYFNDAVFASRDYPSSLAARAARIRAEAAANNAPPVDESVRAFATSFSQAIVGGKRPDLESRVVSGELVRFINASIGTDAWTTSVLRTEQLSGDLIAADVNITVKKLGKDGAGTAVFMLTKTPSGLKLAGIDLFEVR